MAKCKCEESKQTNPRWRIKAQKPKGRGYTYKIVCLSCEWEWWSSARYVSQLVYLSQEEREKLRSRY